MTYSNLQFDRNGFLTPPTVLETRLDLVEEAFVNKFVWSKTRGQLFENYLQFVFDLQRDVFPYFEQWLDGSFVTQKLNPKDIDIVTFLDYRVFKSKEEALERYWSFNMEHKKLDTYFVIEYPPDHPLHHLTLHDQTHWKNIFGATRADELGVRHPKGFLKLIFEKQI